MSNTRHLIQGECYATFTKPLDRLNAYQTVYQECMQVSGHRQYPVLAQLKAYLGSAEVKDLVFARADALYMTTAGMLFIRPMYSMLCHFSRMLHAFYRYPLTAPSHRTTPFIESTLWGLLCSVFTQYANEMYPAHADMMTDANQIKLVLFVRGAFGHLAPLSLRPLFPRRDETIPAWWYGNCHDPPSFDPPREALRVVYVRGEGFVLPQ